MNYQKIFKRETKVTLYIVAALTIVLIGSSYALFLKVGTNTNNQVVEAGSLDITYSSGNTVDSTKSEKCLIPQSDIDANGGGGCLFEFTIDNKGTLPSEYRLLIYDDSAITNPLDHQYIKYSLQRKLKQDGAEIVTISESETLSNLTQEGNKSILTTNTIGVNESITFYLKIWITETAPGEGMENSIIGKKVNLKIDVENLVDENIALKSFDDMKTLASTDENICPLSNIIAVNHSNATIEDTGYNESNGLNLETVQKNLKETEYRYCGSNPNNYVTFNDEDAGWRIIGLVNTPEGQRIKLIKSDYLPEKKAWDENSKNDWTNASLQKWLNEEYLNDFKQSAQDMIDNITWNLGGYSTQNGITTAQYYNYERGTIIYSNNPKLWQGKIALVYPSDYGYATSGGSTLNRTECLTKDLFNWRNVNDAPPYQTDCAYNDWLLNKNNSNNVQWALSPNTSDGTKAFRIYTAGFVSSNVVNDKIVFAPALYLKENIEIASGTGSVHDPYILKTNN